MPVIAVGMIYYGGTALAAGAVGWAALAAGTMVVGGAASLVGTATGDKKLESDGMMVGTIGSLGYGALSAGGYSGVAGANGGTTTAATTGETGLKAGSSAEGVSTTSTLNTPAADATASTMGGTTTATTSTNSELANIMAKSDANMANIAKQNLMAQTASGVAQGYASYEQSKDAKETADEMRAEQTRLTERDYANRNNLTGLTMPDASSLNLPNLTKQAKQKGLIGAAPTTLQVK